jgi:chaperone required for assembly of F1-ATPase
MNPSARRFYKEARSIEAAGGFSVALDGRPLRTPAGNAFVVPTRKLALACAAEWDGQSDRIDPQKMPLTRLANVAIDRTPSTREEMIESIAKHGETDLLCHRADRPSALVERQHICWDPLVAWSEVELGFAPAVVVGVAAAPNDTTALAEAAAALDDLHLTALAYAVGLSGSAIIGYALLRGRLDGAEAYAAAALDDLFQLDTWGEDEEARKRLEHIHCAFRDVERFFRSLGGE